jgi:flagellar basal-body rod modification protein FlgD
MTDGVASNMTVVDQYSYEEYIKKSRTPKNELGKNDFLALLAAQLQYQDPLEPVKDSDFVAQLAQFSSLEQMENMNTSILAVQSYNLVGRYVLAEFVGEDGRESAVSGIVDRVINQSGQSYAQIGETIVKVSEVTQVYDSELFKADNPLMGASALIGRTIKALIPEQTAADGQVLPATEVYGAVTRVAVEDGGLYAYIEGYDAEGQPVESRVSILLITDIRQ